jgi:hypothetical protein
LILATGEPVGSGEITQKCNTGRVLMTSHDLESVALTLVAEGKGILGLCHVAKYSA